MMSDRIRTGLVYLIAMVMVAAVVAAPTVAQVADPDAERVFEVTANADTVDGFSAIGATANKALRARKLVATNRYGQLPSNIIRPRWRELKGVPLGFKDGVDNVGVTGVTLTRVSGPIEPFAANDYHATATYCPAGSQVTGGGFLADSSAFTVSSSKPTTALDGWNVAGYNTSDSSIVVQAHAVCMVVEP